MDEYAAVMNPAAFDFPSSSTSVSGTSDLFSSTFAILSDTAPPYAEQQWTAPDKLHNTYYYETPQAVESFAHINSYDPSIDMRFDAYRPPTSLPAYEPYNPVLSIPVAHPVPLHHPFLDQSLLRQPEPLHVHTHQHSQATTIPTVTMPQPSSGLLARAASPVPIPSIAQRPASSTSHHSTPPHNNNNQSSSPQSDAAPSEEILLNATDCDDEERVMCMACRGVYPSRRSLTGHIGRNEKCREIIGRNYLEQLASAGGGASGGGASGGGASALIPPPPGTESAKAGAIVNGTDGLSPICPFCDRFISHYKGNIRRHINQCGKTGGKRPKGTKGKDGKRRRSNESSCEWSSPEHLGMSGGCGAGSDGMLYDAGACSSSSVPPMPCLSSPPLPVPISEIVQPPPIIHPTAPQTAPQQVKVEATPSTTLLKKEAEIPDDPYLCPFCDFLTVYKGNMKRHMNTCHVNEPDCKEHKLDKMKASVLGVDPATLMEKINAHKANSTRGRRPKKKDPPPPPPPPPVDNMHLSHHHMYQMSPPMMPMHHGHSRMSHMGGMMDYDEMGPTHWKFSEDWMPFSTFSP